MATNSGICIYLSDLAGKSLLYRHDNKEKAFPAEISPCICDCGSGGVHGEVGFVGLQ